MTGALPQWLGRIMGVESAANGEGTQWTLEHSWQWPPWITLLFVLLVAALVITLYRNERSSARKSVRTVLITLRLAAIVAVLLMLAQWVLSIQRTGLPYLVIAIDDSASMQTADDYADKSLAQRAQQLVESSELGSPTRINLAKSLLLQRDGELLQDLERRYRLRYYAVSDEARLLQSDQQSSTDNLAALEATGSSSRLGRGVQAILNDFRGSPPAAVILLTDGVTTEGEPLSDAAQAAWRSGVPFYCVGLGDDQPQRDSKLAEVVVDDVVFSGDVIHFEVTIAASGVAGEISRLTLRDASGTELTSVEVKISADGQPQKVLIPYRPEPVEGVDHIDFDYVLDLATLPREMNTKNNQQAGRVRIFNKQIQVLLVQAYPNYEYRYLKEMLQRDETIKLHTVLQDADPKFNQLEADSAPRIVFPVTQEELNQYDVILFGDVNPSLLSRLSMQHMQSFVADRGGGVIFIGGPRYTPQAYRGTPIELLFPVELASVSQPPAEDVLEPFVAEPTALGLASPPLQIGDAADDTAARWRSLPPLYWMLRCADLKPAARVLAVHPTETDSDGQKLPLISIQYVGAGKVVFHSTDETHRWRFRIGDVYFSRYWVQMIRYLSRTKLGQGGEVELTTDRREYRRGDNVRFRVRFLDEELSPASDDGVSILVQQNGRPDQTVELRRAGIARGVFQGTLTGVSDGDYRAWIAQPSSSSPPSVDFTVLPPAGELERLTMNVADLTNLAKTSRGRFYQLAETGRLIDDLPLGRQVPIDSLPAEPLWNKWPLLFAFLCLLTGEWVLRKRSGML